MGYSKAPEQPQSSARPICHSHAMTRTGREPATIHTAAYGARRATHYAMGDDIRDPISTCSFTSGLSKKETDKTEDIHRNRKMAKVSQDENYLSATECVRHSKSNLYLLSAADSWANSKTISSHVYYESAYFERGNSSL